MKILVIDDEKSIRYSMKDIIEYEGHQVEEASDGVMGFEMIEENDYDLVFCDIKMPKMDGIEVLRKSLEKKFTKFCMISGHGNIETAVECLKMGAVDYIEKPIDLNKLIGILNEHKDDDSETSPITAKRKSRRKKFDNVYESMIGGSGPMLEMFEFIDKVGRTDARVLVTGENGTGKELVAKAIHNISTRKTKPLIEVNCAAIPSELIESELFGHEKGAFTSAIKQRRGSFEQADKGTLFLDEIGDMSLSAQAKVLRVLQENRLTRVGGDKDINVDVRIIAASNKDLRNEIKEGRFREDLYHRLSVIIIDVPPLRKRREDIPLLIDFFLESYAAEAKIERPTISKKAIEKLVEREWSGNVRELKNAVERLSILGGEKIEVEDIEKYII